MRNAWKIGRWVIAFLLSAFIALAMRELRGGDAPITGSQSGEITCKDFYELGPSKIEYLVTRPTDGQIKVFNEGLTQTLNSIKYNRNIEKNAAMLLYSEQVSSQGAVNKAIQESMWYCSLEQDRPLKDVVYRSTNSALSSVIDDIRSKSMPAEIRGTYNARCGAYFDKVSALTGLEKNIAPLILEKERLHNLALYLLDEMKDTDNEGRVTAVNSMLRKDVIHKTELSIYNSVESTCEAARYRTLGALIEPVLLDMTDKAVEWQTLQN